MLKDTDNRARGEQDSVRQSREGARATLAVPWTLRQTLLGTALTVLPLVALLAATQLLTPPNLPVKPVPADVDRLNAFVSGIASALVEGVFLLAPLYFALRAVAWPGGAEIAVVNDRRTDGGPRAVMNDRRTDGGPRAVMNDRRTEGGGPRAVMNDRRTDGGVNAAQTVYGPDRNPVIGGRDIKAGLRALGLRGCNAARALGGVIVGFIAIYLFGALYNLLRIPTNVDALLREAVRAPLTTLATLLVAVAIAPVCEEIFFRGFLLPGLGRAMPVWAAVLLSALVFGFAHADPGSFVPLVAIGVVLGVLRVWTGSVWPGMALHALNNLTAAIYVLTVLHH